MARIPSRYVDAFRKILLETRQSRTKIVSYAVPFSGVVRQQWMMPAPPRHRIGVFCSTIHVDSALVVLQARWELRMACDLEVMFHNTSAVALKGFLAANGPAMITVTQGTADKLDARARAGERYTKLLRVQPGRLRWTSPEAKAITRLEDVRGLRLVHIDHPTDLLAVQDFQRFVAGKVGLELELAPPVEHVPECRDVYQGKKFYLTNSFMDRWALRGVKEPAAIKGWESLEERYLYVNGTFCDLVDGRGQSVARFLRDYLAGRFEDMTGVKRQLFNDSGRLGASEYLLAGTVYLGV